jgi:hypothetical protein
MTGKTLSVEDSARNIDENFQLCVRIYADSKAKTIAITSNIPQMVPTEITNGQKMNRRKVAVAILSFLWTLRML